MRKMVIYMGNVAEKVKHVMQEVKQEKGIFAGHIVANEEEYVREQYVTMLYVFAQVDGMLNQAEITYLKKMTRSLGFSEIAKFMQYSIHFERELLQEFLKVMDTKRLKYAFCLDAIILFAQDGEIQEKELFILTEMAELMRVTVKELTEISKLAKIILEKDSQVLETFSNNNKYIQSLLDYRCYLSLFASLAIAEDAIEEEQIWTGSFKVDKEIIVKKGLTIRHANIQFGQNGKLEFAEGASLFIEDSQLKGAEIVGDGMKQVHISQSSFEGQVDKRVLKISRCDDVSISNSKFQDCKCDDCGGAIYLNDIIAYIHGCTFINCVTTAGNSWAGAIYVIDVKKKCVWENNEFVNCKANSGGAIRGSHIVLKNSILTNCVEALYGIEEENCIHK